MMVLCAECEFYNYMGRVRVNVYLYLYIYIFYLVSQKPTFEECSDCRTLGFLLGESLSRGTPWLHDMCNRNYCDNYCIFCRYVFFVHKIAEFRFSF